jgi:hypothetical protein
MKKKYVMKNEKQRRKECDIYHCTLSWLNFRLDNFFFLAWHGALEMLKKKFDTRLNNWLGTIKFNGMDLKQLELERWNLN